MEERLALAILLGLTVAACATVGTNRADDRQAVIDRIVAASAKITLEQGGRRIGTGSGVVVGSQAGGPGADAVSYVLTAAHLFDGKDGAEVAPGPGPLRPSAEAHSLTSSLAATFLPSFSS
jgi:hypothetical protein